jgi:uncharacterized integral membrane protein
VLVLCGALTVHELRYALAAQHADEHSHAYLGPLLPVACALLVLALVEFGARVAARQRRAPEAFTAAGVRWLTIGSLLLAIFAVQETTELLLAHGRLDLADSLVVHGAWLGAPLAFAVGAVIAVLLRGARVLLTRPARGNSRSRAHASGGRALPRARAARAAVIAQHLASRAPPAFVN